MGPEKGDWRAPEDELRTGRKRWNFKSRVAPCLKGVLADAWFALSGPSALAAVAVCYRLKADLRALSIFRRQADVDGCGGWGGSQLKAHKIEARLRIIHEG